MIRLVPQAARLVHVGAGHATHIFDVTRGGRYRLSIWRRPPACSSPKRGLPCWRPGAMAQLSLEVA